MTLLVANDSTLTLEQKKVAEFLRMIRPTVIPGTNVIASDADRTRWYSEVAVAQEMYRVADVDIWEFCNIAGVPN